MAFPFIRRAYPILKVIREENPVVHFDGHCEHCPGINGGRNSSGSILYHAVEDGVLDPRRTVQFGIRDPINVDVITSNIFKIQIMKNFKYIGSHNTIRSRMHEPIS